MSNTYNRSKQIAKILSLLFVILLITALAYSQAPNTWTQKADFGGAARAAGVGFSIGDKGYVGTGEIAFQTTTKDFWQYDPVADAWSQKADFGGAARINAVGFSINGYGYIGLGGYFDGSWHFYKDFWQYDPNSNSWMKKSDFAGAARSASTVFVIGNKGYLGTGGNNNGLTKDFWEYDPSSDVWTQKADFGGTARNNTTGFSIGSKGYIGTGYDVNGNYKKDFWEYDPAADAWIQKANFGGTARVAAQGFSIYGKGYIGTGNSPGFSYKDFWQYDPPTDNWKQMADYGGLHCSYASSFSISGKGYMGLGGENNYKSDFWEYTPDVSTCAVPANLSSTNVTTSTAKLNWDPVNGVIFYKVSFKKTGTSEWKTIKTITNSKTLHELEANTEYTWKVKSLCSLQPNVASDWSEKLFFTTAPLRLANESAEPTIFVYPNPFISYATILFDLTKASSVTIELMDVNGRKVTVIAKEDFPAGNHEITFDRGTLAAGIYFLQMKTGKEVVMKKLVVE